VTRRLLYLSGLAILGTVLYHSVGWAFVGMFWWADRYAGVAVPDFTQIGSASYYVLRAAEQIIIPSVPSFLFVAGVFAAFASGNSHGTRGWGWIVQRLITLLIPYAIWSLATLAGNFALGDRPSGMALLRMLLVGGVSPGFYFIPLLCQLYVLSPILVPLARRHWRWLLLGTALLEIAAQTARYAANLNLGVPGLLAALTPSWFFPGNVFWFAFGVVMGIHSTKLIGGIVRARWVWLTGAALLLIPGIVEWELLLRASGETWLGSAETLLDNVYTMLFLLAFLGFEAVRLPGLTRVSSLGSKAYGIYLVHGLALTMAAKTIYALAPGILAIPLAFVLVLAACGVGLPLALMAIVRRSPARRAYSYLFG
jgi:hypothetical protein